jgi:hypothetical protein
MLVRAFSFVKFRQRIWLRLEPDEGAEAFAKHVLVGWSPLDWIGPDVNDCGETLRTQQFEQGILLALRHGGFTTSKVIARLYRRNSQANSTRQSSKSFININ